MSDSHIGFDKAANPDALGTLREVFLSPRSRGGIKPEKAESPLYGAILRRLEPRRLLRENMTWLKRALTIRARD